MSRKANINIVSFMLFVFAVMFLIGSYINSTPVVVDTTTVPVATGAGLSCTGTSRYMYAGISSTGECMYFDTEDGNTMVLESEIK